MPHKLCTKSFSLKLNLESTTIEKRMIWKAEVKPMINPKWKNGQKSIYDQNYKMNTSYITLSNVYSIIKLENLVSMISNNGYAPDGFWSDSRATNRGAHEFKIL